MTESLVTSVPLAQDPALPRRDDLLDAGLVGVRLERLGRDVGGPGVRSCVRVRARYRRGESLRATYRVEDESGATRLVSARMFTAVKAATKLLQARDAADDRGAPTGSVLVDAPLATVFWVFPEDRKLRGLAELVSPPESVRTRFDRPWSSSELLAYTPEKAATVRCRSASGETVGFAKVQIGDEGRRSVDALRAARNGIPADGPLHLPDAVGYLADLHMALFSEAPGVPLHELPRSQMPDAMAALGTALPFLHGQPVDGFGPFARLDAGHVAAAADLVTAARPDLATLTRDLVGRLLAAPPPAEQPVLLHGDLHPKNVLVHPAGISLVDLDQTGAGPAAAELGGVLARLWCPRPGDEITRDTAIRAAGALLASYTPRPQRRSLLWYAAAALLVERAARAVSRVDLPTLADMEQVLTTALGWAAASAKERP